MLGARINGFALLSLDESTLRQFGVSFGFWVTLMNIIENLVCDKYGVCYMGVLYNLSRNQASHLL